MAKIGGYKKLGGNLGHGFDKNPQNINRKGQPPKLLRAINNELLSQGYERVTVTQVAEAYELLLGLPEDKIKSYANSKTVPMILRIVAKQMAGKYGNYMIESMLDRAHGKSQSKVDLTTKGEKITPAYDLSVLTDEELKQLNELTAKLNNKG